MSKFEPYKDDQFYKFVHDKTFDNYWDYVPGGIEPRFSPWRLKHFTYEQYCGRHQAAHEQQILLKGQETLLEEEAFQRQRKRLADLCTVHDPSDRLVRQQRTLIDVLCLNPYQGYQHSDYIKMHRVAQEADGCTAGTELSQEEFLRLKRELIRSLQKSEMTKTRLERERQLRIALFPGAYID